MAGAIKMAMKSKKALIVTVRPDLLKYLSSHLRARGYETILTINEYEGLIRLVADAPFLAFFERGIIERGIYSGLANSVGARGIDTLICLVGGAGDFRNELDFKKIRELPEMPAPSTIDDILANLEEEAAEAEAIGPETAVAPSLA